MSPEQQSFQRKHESLLNRVSSDLETRLGILAPSIHTDLFETGCLDSLSTVNLLSYIENEHNVAIDFADLDFQMLSSVESICRLITSQPPDGPSKQAAELEGWAS